VAVVAGMSTLSTLCFMTIYDCYMTSQSAATVGDESLLALMRLCVASTVSAGNAADPPLTATQVRVLNLLSVANGMTLTQVAEALGATAPSASRLCGRLVRDGLVSRAAGPGHYVDLRLTAAGRRAVRTLNARRVLTLRRIIEGLPATTRQQAAIGLRALADAAVADASW
jgi:DNA-binding MarR family transcriptional regulator